MLSIILSAEALEGFLGIQGYWLKTLRDTGYFCKWDTLDICHFILGIWDIFQNN